MATYLITGATGGIGAALAELLRARRHDLILAGRSPDRLAELIERLNSPGYGPTQTFNPAQPSSSASRLTPLVLDLSEPRRIEAALAVADLPERLDGVIHCAGVAELGRVAELDADQWIDHLLVNLVAVAELTRLLLPALRAAHGHIVFVNSGSGLRANPGWSAYAASKHGLRALADSLRAEEPELAVTSVYPGRTASEMQRRIRAQEGSEYHPDAYIKAHTVASVIVNALNTPRDAVVTDISIRGA